MKHPPWRKLHSFQSSHGQMFELSAIGATDTGPEVLGCGADSVSSDLDAARMATAC